MKGGFAMRAASAWPQSRRPSIRPAFLCVLAAMFPYSDVHGASRGQRRALSDGGRLIAAVGGTAQGDGRRVMHRAPSWNVSWVGIERSGPRACWNFPKKVFRNMPRKKFRSQKAIFLIFAKKNFRFREFGSCPLEFRARDPTIF
jgi:hypothetical protein